MTLVEFEIDYDYVGNNVIPVNITVTVFTNHENIISRREFDTREEAIAYWCKLTGENDPGGHFFVGMLLVVN